VAVSMAAYFLVLDKDSTPKELPGISQQGNNSPGNPLVNAYEPGNDSGSTHQGTITKPGQNSANKIPGHSARFTVNPNLENMVGSSSRSHTVRVVSPLNNADLAGEIQFTLENLPKETCRLKILDNKSRVLHSEILKENRFLLKENLGPGLYYWKLETQKDLLHLGKFFIR